MIFGTRLSRILLKHGTHFVNSGGLLKCSSIYSSSCSSSSLILESFRHSSLVSRLGSFSTDSHALSQDSQDIDKQQYNLVNLTNRSVISVSGPDTFSFIQGLITNDVRHLQDDNSTGKSLPCIYSFLLNNSGRILADLFLYSLPRSGNQEKEEEPQLLLEVDSSIGNYVYSILKRFKIRRKLTLKHETDWNVSVIFPSFTEFPYNNKNITTAAPDIDLNSDQLILVSDPRNSCFGYRLLFRNLDQEEGENNSLITREQCIAILTEHTKYKQTSFDNQRLSWVDLERYRTWRYRLGIGEGAIDFPLEANFPFEANAELLNGVSFQKGCFIGQELTARIYHTGVIRKRLLPIEIVSNAEGGPLTGDLSQLSLSTQNVVDQNGKTIGRFRANFREHGIATLKFAELFNNNKKDKSSDDNICKKSTQSSNVVLTLSQSGHSIRAFRPFWWPDSL